MNTIKPIALPDVQARLSTSNFKLTRVGVTGVKKLVHVQRNDRTIPLTVTLDLFVDLPASQKGSHMSRNLELITELIDENINTPVPSLESFCEKTAALLLKRHDYATTSEVHASADYFREVTYPSGKKGSEPYKLIAEAHANSNNGIKKMIGVKVIGITTCPCAMEVIQEIDNRNPDIPAPTHNQRNIGTLMLQVPPNISSVEADTLIEIVEQSFSSPTYSILKRKEEAELVLKAHSNPRFVEDVVREMLKKLLESYPELPDDVCIIARSESEESIHKHNAFAERVTTLGELRK